jgi:hypothetical protein
MSAYLPSFVLIGSVVSEQFVVAVAGVVVAAAIAFAVAVAVYAAVVVVDVAADIVVVVVPVHLVPHEERQSQYEIRRRRFILALDLRDDPDLALDSYNWSTFGT